MTLSEEFKVILDNLGSEEASLQKFLEDNPRILIFSFYQGAKGPTVFPKFRLADDFIPDFVVIGARSYGGSWDVDLVEIEPAVLDRPLFNSKGQSAGRLRDAEGQITKWQTWMAQYGQSVFVPKALNALKAIRAWDFWPELYQPLRGTYYHFIPHYRIVIGRRTDFTGWGDQYRANAKNNGIDIATWDRRSLIQVLPPSFEFSML